MSRAYMTPVLATKFPLETAWQLTRPEGAVPCPSLRATTSVAKDVRRMPSSAAVVERDEGGMRRSCRTETKMERINGKP